VCSVPFIATLFLPQKKPLCATASPIQTMSGSLTRISFKPTLQHSIVLNHITDVHVWSTPEHMMSSSGMSLHSGLILHEWQQTSLSKSSPLSWFFELKRYQGYANATMWRDVRSKYPSTVLAAALRDMITNNGSGGGASLPHLLVSGDMTNISLESEFKESRRFIQEHFVDPALQRVAAAGLATLPTAVPAAASVLTAVPGNHDTYVPSALENNWFGRYFGDSLG
jgi:3',5'-cyclic AMP phosphodiesterase CpdA